jgi:hypothetical protein
VRVPAVERKGRHARPVVGGHQLGCAFGRDAHAGKSIPSPGGRRCASHALTRRNALGLEPLGERNLQDGIAIGIEVEHAARQIL